MDAPSESAGISASVGGVQRASSNLNGSAASAVSDCGSQPASAITPMTATLGIVHRRDGMGGLRYSYDLLYSNIGI
jgi:hypothetical protein